MRLRTNSRLLAQLPALCWTTNADLLITSSFGGMLDRVGTAQSGLATNHVCHIFSAEYGERIEAAHQRALMGEESAFDCIFYARKLRAHVAPLFADRGEIEGVIGIAVDTTAGETFEEELAKTQAALATAEYIAHLGSWTTDYRTGESWWSDELYRILGRSPEEKPLGRLVWAFDHPQDVALIELTIEHALLQRMPYSIEHRIVRPDGTVRIVLEQADFTFDHAGNRIHEVGTLLDTTERVATQQALASVQASFVDAQHMALMGTWDANLVTGEIWWSPGLYTILGIEPDTKITLGELWKFDHPDDLERVRKTTQRARETKTAYSVRYRVVRPDGAIRHVLERGGDFHDWKGDRIRNIGIVIDMTGEAV